MPDSQQLIEFHENRHLRMISIIDKLPDGVSSVYTFFDPDMPQASYGTYNILWQVNLCRTLGLPWDLSRLLDQKQPKNGV